ncbi:tRNA (N6-adenosine(37)-N6)-threonylcarbamoyltransferase complex ATPase TsaE [Methylovorus sp. MM2]|uniref:tRNA (adenosine(37)-N6)-threonylcarbamoyltransferase complex ATPase subunit type 1 TsaE n=1 Tax=Methylovorus sp. MM2 TaxID=1848038 RepID=UPI0007DF2D71|nr:tRNA (adenosine(37)-N6)-threonylcarbamoyltransferase complex ATPase subunit type 1 TsaE [Methylovorus sp. MM2]OAM53050.1 tRNA (N6-adenosine(37)-N6)-threonylcarbamoyltransferase complex ATPase TsaE [Methylovorus sp. MM2]
MQHDITIDLADEAATLNIGGRFAIALAPGLTIYLHGDLGAGKTTLVRGLLNRLGYQGRVKSPTYTLVEPYSASALNSIFNINHFDLYRFIDPEEWDAAGFRDYFGATSVCLVEWPEKAGDLLPEADIDLRLEPEASGRRLTITSNTTNGESFVKRFFE